MNDVVGSTSAKMLADLGLSRDDVIDALMREIGLTRAEADRAWWSTAPSYQAVHSGRLGGALARR